MPGVRLQDVAERAGVSMKTVSSVVRDYRARASADARAGAEGDRRAEGTAPTSCGRRLATGRTGFVALAFAGHRHPVLRGARPGHLAHRGVVRLSRAPGGDRRHPRGGAGAPREFRARASSTASSSSRGVSDLRGDRPPPLRPAAIVLLGETTAPLTMDRVMIDNIGAAREVTSHLAALGRRRIGFVGHERTALTEDIRQRPTGYQEALEEAGIPADPSLLLATDSVSAADAVAEVGRALDAGLQIDALVLSGRSRGDRNAPAPTPGDAASACPAMSR